MSYVLGIDLGTGSLKGLLVDKKGQVKAIASSDYPLIHVQTGYSEQDPNLWIEACINVIEQISMSVPDFKEKLEGISFSGQMHSLVLLDEKNEVLRPAILWNDVRTTKECEQIMAEFGLELLEKTKNIALEGFTLPKILWVMKNEPEIWIKVSHLMLPKDFLGVWMTGNYYMDYSDAAGTLLLNVVEKKWDLDILSKFEINESILPQLIDSSGKTGFLKAELQEKFGFKQEVSVFAGGADNACAAIGAGILDEKTGMASIGTSGVFLSFENENNNGYGGNLHLFNHGIKNKYYAMGVTLAAGHSLNWFRETFAKEKSYDELLNNIETVNPGADGLLFSPYIVGERTPHVDSKIRGSFIGIDTNHKLEHFTRAVIEGITFSLKDSQELMEHSSNKKFNKIVTVGGGAKNTAWQQIQADIFDADILTLKTEQGPGLGAAMLAAVGLNWFESLEDCAKDFVSYDKLIHPIQENVDKYKEYYKLYQELYPSTKDLCHQLLR